MSLNICSNKSNFLNIQLAITDHFRPSVIEIFETKITYKFKPWTILVAISCLQIITNLTKVDKYFISKITFQ